MTQHLPNKFEDLVKVAEELRTIAKELNITIVTATQHPPAPRRFYSVAQHTEHLADIIYIDHVTLLRH